MRKRLTTIPLRLETVQKLKRFGRMGESYDQLINRLLEEREMELILPRQPPTPQELERIAESDDFVSLRDYLKRRGLRG